MSILNPPRGRMDPLTLLLFGALVLMGWLIIYTSEYNAEVPKAIYDVSLKSGRQLVWIGLALGVAVVASVINYRLFDPIAPMLYGAAILLLGVVLLFGKEVAGARAWLVIGPGAHFQPSEIAKYATLLVLARYLSQPQTKIHQWNTALLTSTLIALPMLLIVLQGDTGTALVYTSMILVIYRAGMNPILLYIGLYFLLLTYLVLWVDTTVLLIVCVFLSLILIATQWNNQRRLFFLILPLVALTFGYAMSLDYLMQDFLRPHQYRRIQALINPDADPLGYGWNITQSKIAIGAGGISGKGYLSGVQTQFDFVPEGSTDFIFCAIGEEFGWIGSTFFVLIFVVFLLRLTFLAERQNSLFALYYGYGVVGIFFMHFAINLGMTLGLFPVVGIPLPFISYGGSSLISFTLLLFTFLRLDKARVHEFFRR